MQINFNSYLNANVGEVRTEKLKIVVRVTANFVKPEMICNHPEDTRLMITMTPVTSLDCHANHRELNTRQTAIKFVSFLLSSE